MSGLFNLAFMVPQKSNSAPRGSQTLNTEPKYSPARWLTSEPKKLPKQRFGMAFSPAWSGTHLMFGSLLVFFLVTFMLLAAAGLLHLNPRLGEAGRRFSDACSRAPLLDVVVGYFTIVPWIVGPAIAGWLGLLSAILAQLATLLIWQFVHEALHRHVARGPRIIKVLNENFGAFRNLTALYLTGCAVPIFCLIRIAQLVLYPNLVRLVQFPSYNAGEWINVSRQKFNGLVGHDLVWCLYCDWMTGVYALGAEMLRNVESFWCPIRFACEKKCANCARDFPDVNNGWVSAGGNITEVTMTLKRMYPSTREVQPWFGHPLRQTEPSIRSMNAEATPTKPISGF